MNKGYRYKVKDLKTGKSYFVNAFDLVKLEIIWMSQKCFFASDVPVEIIDPFGYSEVFMKD